MSAEDKQKLEYQKLTDTIKNTIKKQDELYRNLQSESSATFITDSNKYKLDSAVGNLADQRNKIWNYLQNKYEENTKLRKYYFDKTSKNKKTLDTQKKEIAFLENKLEIAGTDAETAQRNVKREIYEQKKYEYYIYLYRIILASLFAILITNALVMINMIDIWIGYIVSLCIVVVMLLYVVYYVYFNNINRDKFDWDKFLFPNISDNNAGNCIPYVSEEDKEIEKLDKLADSKIKEFQNK
jgi:cation transport ATPase